MNTALSLYNLEENASEYFKYKKNIDTDKLKTSTTLYVGNLSFYTFESKIYNLFSQCGLVKKIIMGLNKNTKFPCGFCFVEFYIRDHADKAVKLLNFSKLDDREIRVDWDIGFEEGRQYGRGFSGSQKRDEFIKNYDPDRPKSQANNGYKKDYSKKYDNYHNRDYKSYDNKFSRNDRYNKYERNDKYDRYNNRDKYDRNDRGDRNDYLGKKKRYD